MVLDGAVFVQDIHTILTDIHGEEALEDLKLQVFQSAAQIGTS